MGTFLEHLNKPPGEKCPACGHHLESHDHGFSRDLCLWCPCLHVRYAPEPPPRRKRILRRR